MRRIPIEIANSLNFTGKLNSNERKFNVSLEASPGAIYNARSDGVQYSLEGVPKRILNWFGKTYVVTDGGGLFANTTLIDNGFGDASMFVAQPTAATFQDFLWVAGGTKLRKYDSNNGVYNWGIDPPGLAIAPSLGGGSATIVGRYAYQYYSQTTNQRSNMSPPSGVFNSTGQSVSLTGFVASTDPQVTHQVVLRDLNGGGIFHEVAFKLNDTGTFVDTLNDASLILNAIETNAHGTPPLAHLAILWKGSAWLNDGTNPRRVWVSVPGRPASFEVVGIYDVGESTDQIRAFGVIGGNLFIWTHNKIYLVSGEYPFFIFSPISDLGLISSYAISFTVDMATFGSHSGVWSFNGASFIQLPDIWTLFDPNSHDPRRYMGFDPNNFVVGSNNRHVWVGWTKENGEKQMFQFSSLTRTWTERTPLSVINQNQDLFHTQAGDYSGNILRLQNGGRGFFILHTPEVDTEISEILSAEVDYVQGPVEWAIVVDDSSIYLGILPFASNRTRVAVSLPPNIFGRRIYFRFQRLDAGDFGLAGVYFFINEFPLTTTAYDTGEVPLGHYKQIPQDLILHFALVQKATVFGQLFVDSVLVHSFSIPDVGPAYVGPLRLPVPAMEGRSARLRLNSTSPFVVFHAALGTTPLGDQTIKPIELGGSYPGADARRRHRGVSVGGVEQRTSS